ncbi:MAG: hypothetical protein EPN93_01870 [Spirochaetes bacterium]|nr:MAG: hypothetical protein EPN93_01870 [Spirochaetota bacterium]
MFARVTGYILGAYKDQGYIMRQKSRIILNICIVLFIIGLVFMVTLPVAGLLTPGSYIPHIIIIFIISIIIAVKFLKSGRFSVAAHMIQIISLLAVWMTMFFDDSKNTIAVLDTIVLIPGLMALTPIVTTRKKSAILLYTAANLFIFVLFLLLKSDGFNLGEAAFVDYLMDSGIGIVFVGIMCFHIFRINRIALDRSEDEARKNESQYIVIKGLYDSIKKVSGKLTGHSNELFRESETYSLQSQSQVSAVEEIAATVEEISSGMDLATDNVTNQYDSMRSLMEDINALSGSIERVANRIQSTRSMAVEVSEVASRGGEILDSLSSSFTMVKESSRKMTGIVGMIVDISDKTHLLSLNAAIEAARAGGAGRGFAVVADEISKLADQTATSIKEIEGLIKANVEEINYGMVNIETTVTTIMRIIQGVNTISAGIDDVSSAMEDQKKINHTVNVKAGSVMLKTDEIQLSMQDQKTFMNEIVKSITSLNEITQVYSEGGRTLSVKSHDLDSMVRELHETTQIVEE